MILLLDTYNLYHASMMQWNQSLDYDKVLKHIDKQFKTMYAYVAETEYSRPFANYLRSQGFIVHTKEIRNSKSDSFDVELSLHAYAAAEHTDNLTICSCSVNLLELFRLLQLRGKFLHFYGVGLPSAYNRYGYGRELSSSLIRSTDGNASDSKRLVVSAD